MTDHDSSTPSLPHEPRDERPRARPSPRKRSHLVRYDLTRPDQVDALLAAIAVDGKGTVDFEPDLRRLCSPEAGKTPIALQARRSRDGKVQEASLRRQVGDAVTLLLRRKENLRLVVVYLIEAVSGGLLWRRGILQPVVDDARAHVIRELWHWDNSRLGRMPPTQKEAYRDALEQFGVSAFDLSSSDPRRRDEGVAFERLAKDMRSNRDLHDRARASVSSAQRAFRDRPDFRAGVVNYGFALRVTNIQTGEVRVVKRGVRFRAADYERTLRIKGDPLEIAAVLDMYRWYAGDDPKVGKLGLAKIAHRLNDAGILSPTGKFWIQRAVWLILTNPVYRGTAVYFRRESGNYATAGKDGEPKEVTTPGLLRWRPKGEFPTKDDAHEAIVPAELWDRVQVEIEARSTKDSPGRTRPNQHSLRSSRRRLPTCRCDHCGLAMTLSGAPEDLRCTGFVARGAGACQNYSVDQRVVARIVWRAHAEEIAALLGTTDLRGRLEAHVRRLLAERAPGSPTTSFDVPAARKRIVEISGKIRLLIETLSAASAQYADTEIQRLGAEREALEKRIAEEASRTSKPDADVESTVQHALARIEKLSQPVDEIDPVHAREILDSFIEPGSLRVGFSAAPEPVAPVKGRGRKRSYVLENVKVALLDPRASMLTTTRSGRNP